jgi:NADH-quinone oxidoreductase subunit L
VGHNGYQTFMIIGLIGAFMTAAYMTRATYLTFFGEPRGASAGEHHDEHAADHHDAHGDDHADVHGHDDHASHGPRESGLLITGPLMILAVLALSSGFLNATPFGEKFELLKKWVEPRPEVVVDIAHGGPGENRVVVLPTAEEGHSKSPCGSEAPEKGVCFAPQLEHAKFKWSKAALSLGIVFAGIVLSWLLSVALFTKRNPVLVGLTQRNKLLGAGHRLLVNKYYLDALYENVIVRAVAGPIAAAAYWFNQNVLDGVLHGVSKGSRGASGWLYRVVDQRLVDGTVNNSGKATKGVGGAVQPLQSGKVGQYGALLFSAAAVAALVLVIINT